MTNRYGSRSEIPVVIQNDRREYCSKCNRRLISSDGNLMFPLDRDNHGKPMCKDGKCRLVK